MKKICKVICLICIVNIFSFSLNTQAAEADINIISRNGNIKVQHMQEWARSKKATETFISLAPKYVELASKHGGVNPVLAYVQSGIETGFGKFGGIIDESYNNPCGMKTKEGGDDKDPNAHQRFSNWNEGIAAHLDHLALYAGGEGYPRKETFDPRHFGFIFGKAKTAKGLSGVWATDTSYGDKIIKLYNEIKIIADNDPDNVENKPNVPIYESQMKIIYGVHGEDYGWQKNVSDGKIAGTVGKSKRAEAIKIKIEEGPEGLGIKYRTHSQDILGWSSWKKNGDVAGTTGQKKRLEAIQIELEGKLAKNYDVEYRVHVQDRGWMSWMKNGQMAGTMGEARRIEAIEIKIKESKNLGVNYIVHGEDYGWQKVKTSGQLAGTIGQYRRIEGIKINLVNAPAGLGIRYSGSIQGENSFTGWKNQNEILGTIGKSKRLEAIKIELIGDKKHLYNIEYRVHVKNVGWMSWKRNGEIAGTIGEAKRIEGIEIRITN
ncbi:MAG: glucosaminidase domain-containing protein [Clostridium sp.]